MKKSMRVNSVYFSSLSSGCQLPILIDCNPYMLSAFFIVLHVNLSVHNFFQPFKRNYILENSLPFFLVICTMHIYIYFLFWVAFEIISADLLNKLWGSFTVLLIHSVTAIVNMLTYWHMCITIIYHWLLWNWYVSISTIFSV